MSNQVTLPAIADQAPPMEALITREAGTVTMHENASPLTAQAARVTEVTDALAPAYARASTLELTDEEVARLTEQFPDELVEIRPHDGLIYLPHIHISQRLNAVFKPGKWSLICRRHWFDQAASTMFGEYVLLIRGCFVGESVGGHQYVPNNPKTNYSDALESTAAEALRRIAGKRLGCGAQVWMPDYSRQWVDKWAVLERGKWGKAPKRPTETPTPSQGQSVLPTVKTPPGPTPQPAKAPPANSPKPNPAAIEAWLNMHKTKLIAQLAPNRDAAIDYGKAAGILLPGDDLEDGHIGKWFPSVDWSNPIAANEGPVAGDKARHLAGVAAMMDGHQIPDPSAPPRKIVLPAAKPAITACPLCNHSSLKPDGEYVGMTICQFCGWRFDEVGKCWEAHPWQYVLCPVPPKGASKKEYDKHPITLGQMERTDNKRAFGMVMNFTAEPREWKGKIYQPSAADIKFAEACEQARAHLQKPKAEAQAEQPDDSNSEVPF